MIDDILFLRGHINVKIDDVVGDFDVRIPEYYFMTIRNLTGEVIDSNGSDYEVISLDNQDNFIIDFEVYGNEFECDNGNTVSFEQLDVRCTGKIIQEPDGAGDMRDVLDIKNYRVTRLFG